MRSKEAVKSFMQGRSLPGLCLPLAKYLVSFSTPNPPYGEGSGTPFQYCCLENPMDRGAWWAAVHGVAKTWTRLSDSLSLFIFMHWRRKWQPTPVFSSGESQGWRSLVGFCLWGRTESDMTEATQQQQQQQQPTVGPSPACMCIFFQHGVQPRGLRDHIGA